MAEKDYKQGDEVILNTLISHLNNCFPRLKFKLKIPLGDLFIEPESRWLKSIWQYGHSDISVFRHDSLVCIIEPGGNHHFCDDAQKRRDLRKDKLCEQNKVNILRVGNDFINHLGKGITRKLFKKYFYGEVG